MDAATSAKWIDDLEKAIARDTLVAERYRQTLPADRITRTKNFYYDHGAQSVAAAIWDHQRGIKYWAFSIVRTYDYHVWQGRSEHRQFPFRRYGFVIAFDDHADSSEGEEPWFAGTTCDHSDDSD